MAAANVIVLLSLFILPVVWTGDTEQPLTIVVNALSKLIGYYISNYRNVNLDGLYGLRVAEGHLGLLLKEHAQGLHQHLSASMVSRLQQMLDLATNTSNKALEFVKRDDEEYYMKMNYLIEKPWTYLKKHRKLNKSYIWPPSMYLPQVNLSEDMSDRCMMELLGTGKKPKCSLSNQCLTVMTRRGSYGYSITHQMLWTMLAEKVGCGDVVNYQLKNIGAGGIDEEQAVFCANNFQEMESSVQTVMHGTILPSYQDLFLEQQFVCPSLGFYEFLSSEYLQQILSWQLPSGCYGKNGELPETQLSGKQSGGKNHRTRQPSFKEPVMMMRQDKQDQVQSLPQKFPAEQAAQNMAPHQPVLRMPVQAPAEAARENQVRQANQQEMPALDGNSLGGEKAREQNLLSQDNRGAAQNLPSVSAIRHWKLKNNIDAPPEAAAGVPGMAVPPKAAVPNWRQAIMQSQNAPLDPLKQAVRGWPKDKPRSLRTVPSQSRQSQGQGSDGPVPPRPVPFVGDRQIPGGLRSPFLHRTLRNPGIRLGRKLQAEKELADGCLSHKSAVASGALVMYLRYLIDPGPMVLNQTGHILQETSRTLLEKGNLAADSQKVKKEGLIPVKQNMIQNENDFKEEEEEEEEEDADENPIDNMLDGGADGENMDFNEDEELGEDNADEDANYKDDGDTDADYNDTNDNDDEMYPENNNIDPNNRDRKIVHFGGDRQAAGGPRRHAGLAGHDLKREDENGVAIEGKKKDTADQQAQDDVEYTYYDEPNIEPEKKNVDSPKKESMEKGKVEVPYMGHQAEYPKETLHKDLNPSQLSPKVMYFIFSISFFILFFLAYKFVRRRRLHIRFGPKGFFRL